MAARIARAQAPTLGRLILAGALAGAIVGIAGVAWWIDHGPR